MIAWSSRAGAWLLQLAAPANDTVLVKQIAEPRNWFDTVSGVASILISLALLALCVGLIPAAWNFRKSYGKVNELLDRIYGDVNPIMRHASSIADNVNYVSTAIRVDVQQVNQTIATANERLQDAVRLTERRLNEFNALLEVVQREAEGAFVSTASTVRGVREGAAAFRGEAMAGAYEGEELDEELEDELEEAELDDAEPRSYVAGEPDEHGVALDALAPYDELHDPQPREERDGIVTDAAGVGQRPRVRRRGSRGGNA